MYVRKVGVTPFHVTDVENLFSSLRDGNKRTALGHACRILDRGLNGPPEGVGKGVQTEWTCGDSERAKFKALADELDKLLNFAAASDDRRVLASRASPFETSTPAAVVTPTPAPVPVEVPKRGKGGKAVDPTSTPAVIPGMKPNNPPDQFSRPPHRVAGDDVEAPPPAVMTSTRRVSYEPGAAAVEWDTFAHVVTLVISMLRTW